MSPVVSPDSPAAYQDNDPFNSHLNPVGPQPASPPPQERDIDVARELRKSFIDSVASGSSSSNRETLGPQPTPAQPPTKMEQPAAPAQQAPYNPFARTLATIEPQPVGLSRDDATPTPKAAMDVDAFTRMLLTGNSVSASPVSSDIPRRAPTLESNSLDELHPESPSASDDEHDDEHDTYDHDQSGLFGLSETQSKKPKPPPPAHHHGKALAHKGPQTVSFSDFDASASKSPAIHSPASPKPQFLGSPSDLNKPLPPPPPPHHSPSPGPEATNHNQANGPEQSPQLPDDEFQLQPKKAPPPPLSRRSSQMRSGRPRSASNLSRSSVPDDYAEAPTPILTKPPPPPARRGPQANAINRVPEIDDQATPSRPPPPPPSRNTKQRPPNVSRTPSAQSVASLGQRRISPGTSQMPPPPPPRRSEAKRQSLDGTLLGPSGTGPRRLSETSRRSSGASFHSVGGRTPSITSIPTVDEADSGDDTARGATPQPVPAGDSVTKTASGSDILEDMNAMQREIDALMAKSKSGG